MTKPHLEFFGVISPALARARAHRRAAGTRATHGRWKRGRGTRSSRQQRSLPHGTRPHRLRLWRWATGEL